MPKNVRMLMALTAVLAVLAAACGGGGADASAGGETSATGESLSTEGGGTTEGGEAGSGGDVSGSIDVDGSSTVGPLTQAIAEEYPAEGVTVNVGISGTGGGFERFCAGETDISNASRPISEDEVAACEEAGVDYTEVRVGTDALTMVTNPASEGIDCLTTDDIIQIFGPDRVQNWSEVDGSFPDEEITIYAPDADSGTYDFMVEDVIGLEGSTQDYQPNPDDNIIAQGIIGTPYSWGFFGYAYYEANAERLKAIAHQNQAGECVQPSVEAAESGEYELTRPLFIYVNNESFTAEPAVADFVNFYVSNVNDIIESVGYIPLGEEALAEAQAAVQEIGSGA
jgi:phosphate transport system substrate-binding protein